MSVRKEVPVHTFTGMFPVRSKFSQKELISWAFLKSWKVKSCRWIKLIYYLFKIFTLQFPFSPSCPNSWCQFAPRSLKSPWSNRKCSPALKHWFPRSPPLHWSNDYRPITWMPVVMKSFVNHPNRLAGPCSEPTGQIKVNMRLHRILQHWIYWICQYSSKGIWTILSNYCTYESVLI